MSRPITPTPKLNIKESEAFLEDVVKNLNKPLSLTPTPKLTEAQKIIRTQCNCKICARARRFLAIINNNDLSEEDQLFMKDVLRALYNAEFSYECLLWKREKDENTQFFMIRKRRNMKSQNTINFKEKEVKEYLDKCIIFWRTKKYKARVKNNYKSSFKSLESTEELKASCYIDAFQSVRISLFGELK